MTLTAGIAIVLILALSLDMRVSHKTVNAILRRVPWHIILSPDMNPILESFFVEQDPKQKAPQHVAKQGATLTDEQVMCLAPARPGLYLGCCSGSYHNEYLYKS